MRLAKSTVSYPPYPTAGPTRHNRLFAYCLFKEKYLRNLRNNDFADRRSTAADAKAQLLEAYKTAKEVAEPTRLARQAERMTLVEARDARRAERDRLKLEQQTRLELVAAEEKATAEAAATAETEARKGAENARIARLVEDEAARKAERDRRYAARKARQA